MGLKGIKLILKKEVRVEKLIIEDNIIKGVEVNGKHYYYADKVIIATGGASYPATGSTGDGYKLATEAGHTIIPVRPALVPLETAGSIAPLLQGLSLKNVQVNVWLDGKKQGDAFGEMMFTHFGLTGPIILTLRQKILTRN